MIRFTSPDPAADPDHAGLRRHALEVFRAAVEAADPVRAVRDHLEVRGDALRVDAVDGPREVPLPGRGRVWVVGAGKGSAPIAQALEELLGDRIAGGLVCVKDGHGAPTRRVEIREASHPVPDARGVAAAERIVEIAGSAGEHDLVVCALSGGGSALLTLPAEDLTLDDLRGLTDVLLACGASIDEINTLRKHVSRVKGGQLARIARPAAVVNVVLSDVVGDRLDVIASGPLSADPTTFADAWEILERYAVADRVPRAVRDRIRAGVAGAVPDTPKPGDPALAGVVHAVVGSNLRSLEAAAATATELGYTPLVLSSLVEGEAREAARVLAAVAKQCRLTGTPVRPPACILAGGETTVTLRGDGRGGRNQEMAVVFGLELEGWDGIAALSGGTDGTDGPTDAAGGLGTPTSTARARHRGLDPRAALARNDSYPYLDAIDDLVRTGPTRTNVMDVQVLVVA